MLKLTQKGMIAASAVIKAVMAVKMINLGVGEIREASQPRTTLEAKNARDKRSG